MAFDHLERSLTRGNLWLYILAELQRGEMSPGEIREAVEKKHRFSPAGITFYTVLYRLRREGLVRRASEEFRSKYSITTKGKGELAMALEFMEKTRSLLSTG